MVREWGAEIFDYLVLKWTHSDAHLGYYDVLILKFCSATKSRIYTVGRKNVSLLFLR